MKLIMFFLAILGCAFSLGAQTRVDLRTQGKAIDFADATSTRPAKTGSVLPATCSTGQLFFLTTAPAGKNLYGCIGTNVWSVQSEAEQLAAGDVTGPLDAVTVTKIRGRAVSTAPPANGEALVWNESAGQWQPSAVAASGGGAVASVAGKTGVVTLLSADLTDCKVTRESASTLRVSNCRAIFPNKNITVLPSATIVATAGQGTAFIYVMATGRLYVGRSGNLNISCTGCYDAGAMTDFPLDVKRVWTFATEAPATWGLNTGTDQRNAEPTLIEQGSGILISQSSGTKTIAADTAVMQTKAAAQSGREILCVGSTGANATCKLTPTLITYTAGMRLNYVAGATNTATMTLNVDSLGAKPILKHDGSALAAGDVTAGRYYMLTYDGAGFRLPNAGSASTPVAPPPTSAAAPRQVEYIGAKCQNGFAASGFSYGTAGFPTAACFTGSNGVDGVLQFADTETMTVYDRTTLPSSVSAVSGRIWWRTTATTGNITWQIQTACVAGLEPGSPNWNAAQTIVSAAPATANQWTVSTVPSLTLTGCAADEVLKFRFFRDPAHASDTIGATAELLSLVLTMTP